VIYDIVFMLNIQVVVSF